MLCVYVLLCDDNWMKCHWPIISFIAVGVPNEFQRKQFLKNYFFSVIMRYDRSFVSNSRAFDPLLSVFVQCVYVCVCVCVCVWRPHQIYRITITWICDYFNFTGNLQRFGNQSLQYPGQYVGCDTILKKTTFGEVPHAIRSLQKYRISPVEASLGSSCTKREGHLRDVCLF